MAESHVVSGLVAKRSELSGIILNHQTVIKQLTADIVNIDGAIKLFEPDYDLRTIKAKAPRQANPWFEHGEVGRMVLDALRGSTAPLSTRQIGEAMLVVKGVIVETSKERDALLKIVLCAAQSLERKGIVKMVGRVGDSARSAMLWMLA